MPAAIGTVGKQLEDKCMRLEAELTSCQKLLADSENQADLMEAPQKKQQALKYPLCLFSDSETSSEFGADRGSSDEEEHV